MEITMIELENVKDFIWKDSKCGYTKSNSNYTDIELNHTYPSYILGQSTLESKLVFNDNADKNYNGEFF